MKVVMDNWRSFLNKKTPLCEGPILQIPASSDTKKYQKMIKAKTPPGFQGFDLQYTGDEGEAMTEEYAIKYLKKMVMSPPNQETLRNLVRYFVRKYCKNEKILKIFNHTEKFELTRLTKVLLKVQKTIQFEKPLKYKEKWSSMKPNLNVRLRTGRPIVGSAGGHLNTGSAIINMYKHPKWDTLHQQFAEDLLPFIKKASTQGISSWTQEDKYDFSAIANFSRFLNILRAVDISTTYVHELAHIVDTERKTRHQAEINATKDTIPFIEGLSKGIVKDVFESSMPGNYNSWAEPDSFLAKSLPGDSLGVGKTKRNIENLMRNALSAEKLYQQQHLKAEKELKHEH
jgi:hypothetical protein